VSGPRLLPLPSAAPIVLVTVGTDHHRFDRLVSWADEWAADAGGRARVVIQTGTSMPPKSCVWQPYFERSEMAGLVSQSSAFVCHGGPGTIFEARSAGFVPIVVPRRHALKEHVDDHQVRFCARVAESGFVVVADTQERFAELLDKALQDSPSFRTTPDAWDSPMAVARFAQAADSLLATRAARRPHQSDPNPLVRQ
jgi:UDP-N-acetylglucosamine transferase subunit ALG13